MAKQTTKKNLPTKQDIKDNEQLKRFVNRIVSIRTKEGQSISELSKALGILPTQLSYFENTGGAKTVTILKLLNYLQKKTYNLNWLVMDDNSSHHMKYQDELSVVFDLADLEINLEEQVKKHTQFLKEMEKTLTLIKKTSESI